MKFSLRMRLKRIADSEGIATIEFALMFTAFFLVLLGIVEFGYDWYFRTLLNNASRDGARYGAMYSLDSSGNNIPPNQRNPTISDYVKTLLVNSLPTDVYNTLTVDCTGAGNTSGKSGDPLTVKVTATKSWNALGGFITPTGSGGGPDPNWGVNSLTVSEQTTMTLE